MILIVFDDDAPQFTIRVAYGNLAAYAAAGLSYDTMFDLRQGLDLQYTTEWFSVPPSAPHAQIPKVGTLNPYCVRAAPSRPHSA